MGFLRAIRNFFSFIIKLIVVIALMIVFALGSYEGVTFYLTGSFHDLRETKQAVEEQTQDPMNPVDTAQKEVNHENSLLTLLFYSDVAEGYFDARIQILDKNTGMLDILLLPSSSKFTVTGKLKKTLSERINISNNMVSFEDIARCFPEDKYNLIEQLLAEATGLEFTGHDVMTREGMTELLGMAGPLSIPLKHDLTYRNEEKELEIISSEAETLKPNQVAEYMRYLDGSSSEIANRLQGNVTVLEALSTSLLEKKSATDIFKKYGELVASQGTRDDQAIQIALKKTNAESVTVRVLQGSESMGSYTVDSQKAQLQISGLINQAAAQGKSGSENTGLADGTSQEVTTIELYNAGYISGLAAAWQEYLEKHGYKVSKVDNYKEGTLATTEIVVTQEGMEEDLLKYFPDAQVSVEDIPSGVSMVVYLGKDSAYILPGHEKEKPDGVELEEDEEEDTSTEATTEIEIIEDD